jgi:hypothetical protein
MWEFGDKPPATFRQVPAELLPRRDSKYVSPSASSGGWATTRGCGQDQRVAVRRGRPLALDHAAPPPGRILARGSPPRGAPQTADQAAPGPHQRPLWRPIRYRSSSAATATPKATFAAGRGANANHASGTPCPVEAVGTALFAASWATSGGLGHRRVHVAPPRSGVPALHRRIVRAGEENPRNQVPVRQIRQVQVAQGAWFAVRAPGDLESAICDCYLLQDAEPKTRRQGQTSDDLTARHRVALDAIDGTRGN